MNVWIFLLLIIQSAFANKHMMIIGAGGEPLEKNGKRITETIFDSGLKSLGIFTEQNKDWNSSLIYNGGHSSSEDLAKKYFTYSPDNNKFTAKNYEDLITKYETLISSGQVTQLMIPIMTHGAMNGGQKTHLVSTAEGVATDLINLKNSPTVSLDRLKDLADLALRKNIKLAIIDLSCHSGSTLVLANDNTCVISGTGPRHYGYAGANPHIFSSLFMTSLGQGKNLEDIYLAARERYKDPSFPMISTPQGREVNKLLYDGVSPYMFFDLKDENKLDSYLGTLAREGQLCEEDPQMTSMLREVEALMKVASIDSIAIADEFKTAVKNYYDHMKVMRKWYSTSSPQLLNREHQFCMVLVTQYGKANKCRSYTSRELMTLNVDPLLSIAESGKEIMDKADVSIFRKIKKYQAEFKMKNPELRETAKDWETTDYMKKSEALRDAVVAAQRKVYQSLYKQSKATGPNPCRDFVL